MNSLLLYWAIAIALCFLARYPFQKTNVQLSIFFFFLGVLLLGCGALAIGGYYAMQYVIVGDWAQAIINILMLLFGAACVWISAKPITQIVQSWFK